MHAVPRRALAATLAIGGATALALAAPLAASAHVTLEENTATPGSSVILTFKVPNESDDQAGANKLVVTLPSDTPFAGARYVPVAGWTAEVDTTELPKPVKNGDNTVTQAVTKVTWTANDGIGIPPGALGLFPLQLSGVPDVGKIPLPADEGYTDGTVVSWSETTANAEHPAPVLYVNDPPPAATGSATGPSASATPVAAAAGADDGQDLIARVLGIGGVVVGAVGIVVGVTGRRPAPKRGS